MKPQKLSIKKMFRKGSSSQTKRESLDLIIDGRSLLKMLADSGGGVSDFMGCFVFGFESENLKYAEALKCESKTELESGRVLLYICPECGDIGCGSYAARVEEHGDQYMWSNFAYENGYEEPQVIDGIGPYYFNKDVYDRTVNEASAI